MAVIEIQPLTERLSDEEIEELAEALETVGAPRLPRSGEGNQLTIAEGVDEDVLDELLDKLEEYDAACEIYLPAEFEGRVAVGDMQVGSLIALVDALDGLHDELFGDDDDDEDEEDDEDDSEVEVAELRKVWKLVLDGANEALDRSLPLHLVI